MPARRLFLSPIVEIDPRDAQWEAILSSDAAFRAWADRSRGGMLVRASVYAGREIHCSQEVGSMASVYGQEAPVNGFLHTREPRRPIAMKGARCVMIAKRSHTARHIANGYCEEVAKRYLRRVKYTCADQSQHRDNMERLESALRRRHHCSHAFGLTGCGFFVGPAYHGADYAGEWIGGVRIERPIRPANPALPHIIIERRPQETAPKFRTTKPDERAILRAVYELGLVKEGDIL